jgi:hypothetical protein
MRDGLVFLAGIVYGIIVPPGLTSFFLVELLALFSAGNPLLIDPGMIGENLLLYMGLFILPEIVLAAVLSGRKAGHLGRWLMLFAAINLVVGILAYLSTMTCGGCGLPPRPPA